MQCDNCVMVINQGSVSFTTKLPQCKMDKVLPKDSSEANRILNRDGLSRICPKSPYHATAKRRLAFDSVGSSPASLRRD